MKKSTTKVMVILLIILAVVFGAIFGFKMIKNRLIKDYLASHSHPIMTVSTMKVGYDTWQPQLTATGSLRAVQGVNVTTQTGGMVTAILFKPGADVKAGDLLVELNAAPAIGQLNSLEAQADLAAINLHRDMGQYLAKAVSKAQIDSDVATLKSDQAQVQEQAANVAEKMVHAPFSGRLGVSAVNLGQFVNPGDLVVTLQSLNPLWMDFYLPEQQLGQVKLGQQVSFTSDSFPDKTFSGTITTINPAVETSTRNVQVEATIANPDELLLPGMFASVTIESGAPQRYLTVPQAAISFNSYGDIAYLVKQGSKDAEGKPQLTVEQTFVTLGDTRGDQVSVLKGLKEGDEVVTSGQLKLKNGSPIAINNAVQPLNNPDPNVVDQ